MIDSRFKDRDDRLLEGTGMNGKKSRLWRETNYAELFSAVLISDHRPSEVSTAKGELTTRAKLNGQQMTDCFGEKQAAQAAPSIHWLNYSSSLDGGGWWRWWWGEKSERTVS